LPLTAALQFRQLAGAAWESASSGFTAGFSMEAAQAGMLPEFMPKMHYFNKVQLRDCAAATALRWPLDADK
jgi:hypothetical protein